MRGSLVRLNSRHGLSENAMVCKQSTVSQSEPYPCHSFNNGNERFSIRMVLRYIYARR